ncbi:amidohydrolase [Dehalobacterium formicoaceticum]|uniref:amidohydrolase n=1 Tax=Dehalobacterium formicoaceticum TaxID=51515 RepID=UPI000B7CCFB6|nr:amidohydrolase [Dehalobacterium formicoaceticum]
MKILIKNALIYPMTEEAAAREEPCIRGNIAISQGKISGVGQISDEEDFDKIIDGTDCVAIPGLVNTHTHGAMTLLRSYADDMPLMDWLQKKIWPIENLMTDADIYWGTLLSIVEMIKSGTTTFADMYIMMDQVARAVDESGMRGVLARGMTGLGANGEKALLESVDFIKNWQGKGEGRITTMMGPHAPYTCPPDFLKKALSYVEQLGVGIHIHLAETLTEVADIEKEYGKRPVALMDEVGLFQHHVLAAHVVHVNEQEIELLADKKVKVAHNPQSNMKLASGIAPVAQMLKKGITVAIGTDGASSNNNLDMIEEMRTASFLQKVAAMDPTVLPAYQVLAMATRNGADALNLTGEIGQIAVGKKADIILVDFHQPHLYPHHDAAAHLVYAAKGSDVKTVLIDGKVVMENRQLLTLDEERILYEAEKCTRRLVEQVN